MPPLEPRVLRTPLEVDPILASWSLSRAALLRVRDAALGAAADATPYFAANAAGTLSYHHGVPALRYEFVGKFWIVDRPTGIEVIRNPEANLMIGFANVDIACIDSHGPKPRSDKGAGTERMCQGNLFGSLPQHASRQRGIWKLYYLMVAENGAAELSCPIVEDGTFVTCVDRLYLSDGSDFGRGLDITDDSDVATNFDPQVIRKHG